MRHEIDLDLAGDHFGLGFGIEADVRGDELDDRAGADQLADPLAGPGGVVGDHGQVLRAATNERVDEAMRRTGAHEAADEQRRAVGYQRRGCVGGYRGLHALPLPNSRVAMLIAATQGLCRCRTIGGRAGPIVARNRAATSGGRAGGASRGIDAPAPAITLWPS